MMDGIGDALTKVLTKEPTRDELLMLRRAARVLRRTTLRDEDSALVAAYAIDSILDDADAPQLCESCDEEGIYSDDEGCYACRSCVGDGV